MNRHPLISLPILLFGLIALPALVDAEPDMGVERPVNSSLTGFQDTLSPSEANNSDLAPTPEFAAKLGLGFTPPPGSIVREHRNRGRDVLQILDAQDPPSWTISFQRIQTDQFGQTTKTRVDSVLQGLEAQKDPSELLSRTSMKNRVLDGNPEDAFPAELIYLKVPFDDTPSGGISGLLVAQTSPYTFLYGTLFALRDEFGPQEQALVTELIDSLRIQPESVRQMKDAGRVQAAGSVLAALTPEVLRTIALQDKPEFYRVYQQNPDGTQDEIAWQRLSTSLAPVSAVSGAPDNALESAEPGLLVTIVGEIVSTFPKENLTIDVAQQHWISLDRLEERWSTHRTPRRITQVGNRRIEKEVGSPIAVTGIRTRPQPRSSITLIDADGIQTDLDVPVPSDLFISQTELYVLGRLMKEAGVSNFDVDWYFMEEATSQQAAGIRKRSDRYSAIDSTQNGAATLETRGPSGLFLQTFSPVDGVRISKMPSDGKEAAFLAVEQIEPQALIELYKAKNLPTR